VANSPVRFPEELPISARIADIASAIAEHQVVIIAGETGSGKTTQLPKLCLAMGRGLAAHIGVTQPRRIAATSVAARVARELDVELGREVGYQIRFANKTTRDTYVKFMTDGILLAEIHGDPMLRAYDTLIVDEAHERSLNIDFLLGYLKRLLPKRPDLRVIVSSATLEHDRFAEFFDGAPVIQVSGRTYPVEVIYRESDGDLDLAENVADTVEEITAIDPREDILVFLPGEREIRDTEGALAAHGLPHTTVLPLYGRLAQADQARVFQTLPQRRIVLSTNVAETSLTIPGIVYVIDAGLARVNRYDARTGVTRLLIEPISRASADQRKGRAGRTRSGVCFRLYEKSDFDLRAAYTDPEITRVGLAGAILQMKAIGLGDIESFPLLDPPPKRAIDEGYRVLEEIGAIDGDRALTDIGNKLARLPVDPRIGRMILAGEKEGALREVLILAAALGVQDPRERPLSAQQRADDAHRRFKDEESDFVTLLKIWRFYQDARSGKTNAQVKKACRDAFLNEVRLREWADVHYQLSSLAKEMGFAVDPKSDKVASNEAIHRALLPGLLSKVATWNAEHRVYLGARQTRFKVHPSSALSKKPPAWIVAAELVETTQLFARGVAKIDPAWLEAAGGALCRRSYGDPIWTERTGQVMCREQVTLYGLPIVRDRRVHFGPIDPRASHRIFVLHALVRGEWTPHRPRAFQKHNRDLFEQVAQLRARARRSDMSLDDDAVAQFFEARLPDSVYSGKTFEAWLDEAEKKDPRALFLSLDDILLDEASDLSPARFPNELVVAGVKLPLSYRFDPTEDDDGATITLPIALLPSLDPRVMEWTIPGWHAEKILLLLHGLPKGTRKNLGSIPELARSIALDLKPFEGPMLTRFVASIRELTGERIGEDAFRLEDLPPHLRLYFRIVDGGRTVGEGRDLRELQQRHGARAKETWAAATKPSWEKEGLVGWTFDALPEERVVEAGGARVVAYPALVDTERSVAIRGMATRAAADEATRAGLRRLLMMHLGTSLGELERQVPAQVAASSLSDGGAAPRRVLALRGFDEAFALDDPRRFPRDKKAFLDRVELGRSRFGPAIATLGKLALDVVVELDKARADLKALTGKPGAARASLEDVRAQLTLLAPADMLRAISRDRLAQLPRYLKAIRVRLERLPNGPQKDQAKAAQVTPFWNDYLAQRDRLLARGVAPEDLDMFRWMLEEYRVAVFAPEIRAAVPVSPQRLKELWSAICG
jgi:ATP-dependent helicase HrpA